MKDLGEINAKKDVDSPFQERELKLQSLKKTKMKKQRAPCGGLVEGWYDCVPFSHQKQEISGLPLFEYTQDVHYQNIKVQ